MEYLTRRGFFGLAGAAGVATGLAACAGTGGTTSNSGSSNSVEFWSNHPGTSKDTETTLVNGFQQANSGLTVKLIDAGSSYEDVQRKFNAALAGGQLPDVVIVSDVTWFNFAVNGQLTAIDDLVKAADIDTSDYVDTLFNDYKFNSKHYALPYSRSTPLFYYNKAIWSSAGLPDRGPKDWDEFLTWAPKIKAAVGSGKQAMALPDGSNYLDWVFQNMAWDNGGAYSKNWTLTFTDPGTVKAGQYLQDLAKGGYVKFGKTPEADFSAGIAGCAMQSTGSLGGIKKNAKFDVGTAFLPGTDNCPTGGAGLAIPNGISDARKANAMKFIGFMTSPESTITFTRATGYMPVRKSALENADEKAYLEANPNFKTAVEQLAHTRSQDYARVFFPGGGAAIGKAMDQIARGQDPAAVFATLQTQLQTVFDTQLKMKVGG